MTGHAQLKFVMTECSKTQIRLTGPKYRKIEKKGPKYRKIEKKCLTLPSEVLAFRLIKRANITRDERLLILVGINYEDRSSFYEQAVKSLKKNQGRSRSFKGSSIPSGK